MSRVRRSLVSVTKHMIKQWSGALQRRQDLFYLCHVRFAVTCSGSEAQKMNEGINYNEVLHAPKPCTQSHELFALAVEKQLFFAPHGGYADSGANRVLLVRVSHARR